MPPSLLTLAAAIMCSAPISVELDVFSGRPNPTWNLSESQCITVEQYLDQLPDTTNDSWQSPSGLGYRGLIIHYETQEGVRASIRVYRGIAQSERIQHQDPGRRLERWLLNTNQDSIDSSMRRYLQTELDQ